MDNKLVYLKNKKLISDAVADKIQAQFNFIQSEENKLMRIENGDEKYKSTIILSGLLIERNQCVKALKLLNAVPSDIDELRVEIEVLQCKALSNMRLHKRAVERSISLLSQYPNSIDVLLNASASLRRSGRKYYPMALDLAVKAYQMEPSNLMVIGQVITLKLLTRAKLPHNITVDFHAEAVTEEILSRTMEPGVSCELLSLMAMNALSNEDIDTAKMLLTESYEHSLLSYLPHPLSFYFTLDYLADRFGLKNISLYALQMATGIYFSSGAPILLRTYLKRGKLLQALKLILAITKIPIPEEFHYRAEHG